MRIRFNPCPSALVCDHHYPSIRVHLRPSAVAIPLVLILVGPHVGCGQAPTWSMLKDDIRASYPSVRHISSDSLATWLASPAPAPLLLDVRAEAEFAVSHLPDARRIDPDTHDLAFFYDLPRDTPIVAYCAVGYRSSAMAEQLSGAGFTNVVNLEGAIFEWANEGHPVYRDDRVVLQVHPYDAVWGLLLKKELRAYTPSPE